MTEQEWNECHPAQYAAYLTAFERKLERQITIEASNKLLHCHIHGVKIDNRKPRIEDFLPRKKTPKKGNVELSKARAQVAALQSAALANRKKS